MLFSNVPVFRSSFQKHLGIDLDQKLNFNRHIKEKMAKVPTWTVWTVLSQKHAAELQKFVRVFGKLG